MVSPTTASITSILYGKQRDNSLYSSSSANGIIKLWDLRDARSAIQSSEKSLDSTMRDITNHMSPSASLVSPKRARGICSMALDPSGSTIYAVAADSRIHQYSALTLQPPTSHVKNLTPHLPEPLSDPHLKVSSFYVRVAVSPCGQWLACGSSGGQVLVWSLGADFGSRTVILNPGGDNAGRETGAVDWASDGVLSSCSDDRTVRVWRPDVVTARSSRADVNGMATDWAVAS
ncbi:hypothetical protein FRB99_008262 [Tulasnella sp. 403]|nr:hypothetical protein FRB99_008262 [Tulasnella sp. 403]